MAKWFRLAAVCAFSFVVLVSTAQAADPSGTWKWSVTFNDMKREQTLVLKLDGDKLTGDMLGRNDMKTAISDASFKEDTVSFSVTRERNGMKSVQKYHAKLDGDTLTGKIESERDGKANSRDWEAKRQK